MIKEGRVAEVQRGLKRIEHDYRNADARVVVAVRAAWDLIDELFDELESREPLVNGYEYRTIDGRRHERWTAKGPWKPTEEDEP